MFTESEIKKIRGEFPILSEKNDGKDLVYFDNGATSQRPKAVVDAVVDFYERKNSNVHRGIHFLADRADSAYEEAREKLRNFVGAGSVQEIVFTRNATEALNMVAFSYGCKFLQQGDEVVLTEMEHHSNIVPWQMLAREVGVVLKYVRVGDDGRLDMEHYRSLLGKRTKLVSVVHASNVLGVVNPIGEIVAGAREVGAKICVDACQSVPHMKVDVKELDCDFLAFSGHKMCGPMGIGVLYGKKEILQEMGAFLGGGSMISNVSLEGFEVAGLPEKFDAGTPNVAGAVGLGAAVDYLLELGMDRIHKYEMELGRELIGRLESLSFVRLIGPGLGEDRLAIVSFVVDGVHAHDVAEFLSNEGICVRAGHHCAQPLMERFGVVATARASLYFYNTSGEVQRFLSVLEDCYKFFN